MPASNAIRLEGFKEIARNLGLGWSKANAAIEPIMLDLGDSIAGEMKASVEDNAYTGALSDSMEANYNPRTGRLLVRPMLLRGGYWGGDLLEYGSKPHYAPWAPIKEYADYRGIPAGALWYTIATEGTKPHPFMQRAFQSSAKFIKDATGQITKALAGLYLNGQIKGGR